MTVIGATGALQCRAMETVYKVGLGFQHFCVGSYDDLETAESIVDIVNADRPGEYRIVHSDGFITPIIPARSNGQGLSILN